MGFFDKLFSGLSKTRVNMEDLEEIFRSYEPDDDEFFDELEELLIMADMGAETVDRVVTSMHYLCFDKNVKRGDKARELLIGELEKELDHMLELGLRNFDRKIRGFGGDKAVITGPETRTSSPLRITRGEDMQALGIGGLYPCGEGAGYAGGIVSAAVDGVRVAQCIAESYKPLRG